MDDERWERNLRLAAEGMAKLAKIKEYLTLRHVAKDAALTLNEALSLPVLGGVMRESGHDSPSRTFTKSSMELAVRKGCLKATMVNGKLRVTPEAVRAWVTTSEKSDAVGTADEAVSEPGCPGKPRQAGCSYLSRNGASETRCSQASP